MSPNQGAIKAYQNLFTNRNQSCRKNINFADWSEGHRVFFLNFWILGVTKHGCFQKKPRFSDKIIIKNVQNEILYKKLFLEHSSRLPPETMF